MGNPLLLTLCILGFCLLVIFYIVSTSFYKRRNETKYHFYQMFPYELNYPSFFKENIYGNIIIVLACIAVMAFYEIAPIRTIYAILAMVLSILITMMIILLIMLPVKYLKTHMLIASLEMTLCSALPLINLLFALERFKVATDEANKVLCIVSMALSGLFAIAMLVNVLNPKLSFNIRAIKKVDENGNETYERPKIILMAICEWCGILTFFLSPLAVLLLYII